MDHPHPHPGPPGSIPGSLAWSRQRPFPLTQTLACPSYALQPQQPRPRYSYQHLPHHPCLCSSFSSLPWFCLVLFLSCPLFFFWSDCCWFFAIWTFSTPTHHPQTLSQTLPLFLWSASCFWSAFCCFSAFWTFSAPADPPQTLPQARSPPQPLPPQTNWTPIPSHPPQMATVLVQAYRASWRALSASST